MICYTLMPIVVGRGGGLRGNWLRERESQWKNYLVEAAMILFREGGATYA